MHIHRRRSGTIVRNTLGGLRPPRSTSGPRWKCLPTGFLLANRGGRRHQDCTHLPRVSILRKADAPTRSGLANNTHHLVVCCVGSRPRRSRAEGPRGLFTNIIHRFGVPNSIITDNGTQFTGRKFLDFCEDHHIRVDWASVAHPMTNGQVERANGMVLQGLKPRIYNDLNKFGRRWMKELPSVVWSLRTTPSRAMGFTPFFLVYGAEANLPTDLEYGSPRTRAYDDRSNRTNREDSLD
jgi:transposase InsO family protein